jgi:hypothetical protein
MMDRDARKWMWIGSIGGALAPALGIAAGQAGLFGANPATYFGLGMLAMLAIGRACFAGRDALRIARRQTAAR